MHDGSPPPRLRDGVSRLWPPSVYYRQLPSVC